MTARPGPLCLGGTDGRSSIDFEETKIYASERIIRSLCSGRDFQGLGPEAERLIQVVAQHAEQNALLISQQTTRTREVFIQMHDQVRDQFVLDVLGWGARPMSPQQAAIKLVVRVWNAYIAWATAAQ